MFYTWGDVQKRLNIILMCMLHDSKPARRSCFSNLERKKHIYFTDAIQHIYTVYIHDMYVHKYINYMGMMLHYSVIIYNSFPDIYKIFNKLS